MILYYIVILFLCLIGISFSKEGYHKDYLSKENTNAIKGIFLLLIVISHSLPYLTQCGYHFNGFGDPYVLFIRKQLGQLVVVLFLFYSGYGICESWKKKGSGYVKSMPTHRILTTLLNFDVAVFLFALLCLILSIPFTTKQFFLSLIAWDSVGNSNWYIFCILICYLISYIVLRFSPPPHDSKKASTALTFIILITVSLLLSFYKEPRWYNTLWAYGAGFAFSNYKTCFEKMVQKNYCLYLGLFIVLFVILFLNKFEFRGIRYNLLSISFAFLIVILTMKFTINNTILGWVGKNLFPMYIYQRLPMIILQNRFECFTGIHPVLFVAISLFVTVGITFLYKYWRISLR